MIYQIETQVVIVLGKAKDIKFTSELQRVNKQKDGYAKASMNMNSFKKRDFYNITLTKFFGQHSNKQHLF